MTYNSCKKVIENTVYTSQEQKNEMLNKLDIFLLNNRISDVQYTELVTMLNNKQIVTQY